MERKGIPTIGHDGIKYRSITEARWAEFFHRLGWEYEYEPFELKGYIPDFVLKFKEPILVEVKPEVKVLDLEKHVQKILDSGWGGEFVILGSSPDFDTMGKFGCSNGYLRDLQITLGIIYDRQLNYGVDICPLIGCTSCKSLSLSSENGSFGCRKCSSGGGSGKSHQTDLGFTTDIIRNIWVEVKNKYQWHPKKTPPTPTTAEDGKLEWIIVDDNSNEVKFKNPMSLVWGKIFEMLNWTIQYANDDMFAVDTHTGLQMIVRVTTCNTLDNLRQLFLPTDVGTLIVGDRIFKNDILGVYRKDEQSRDIICHFGCIESPCFTTKNIGGLIPTLMTHMITKECDDSKAIAIKGISTLFNGHFVKLTKYSEIEDTRCYIQYDKPSNIYRLAETIHNYEFESEINKSVEEGKGKCCVYHPKGVPTMYKSFGDLWEHLIRELDYAKNAKSYTVELLRTDCSYSGVTDGELYLYNPPKDRKIHGVYEGKCDFNKMKSVLLTYLLNPPKYDINFTVQHEIAEATS